MAIETQDEIEGLIKASQDPQARAILIVLNNINQSLIANTRTINDVDNQLKQHLIEFNNRSQRDDALLNQGKGAWKIVGWSLGIGQAIAVFFLIASFNQIQSMKSVEHNLDTRVTIVEQQIKK